MKGVEGRSRSSRRQLCTSLCGMNNTEWQDSAKQKRNRKRPMESSFQQPCVSLVLPNPSTHPHVTQVSVPCSAAHQVKSHSCQWDSQVGNVLFRAPYSQLRADMGCKSWNWTALNNSPSPEIEQAGCEREKAGSEKAIWVLMKRWWMGLRPRQQ